MKYRKKSIVVKAVQFTEEMIKNNSYPDCIMSTMGVFYYKKRDKIIIEF